MSKYDHAKTEAKWQKVWLKEKIYEPSFAKASDGHGRTKFYNLMMFPYPSAEGLHVGNMYAFVGSDIYGRFKRMQGYDVFEPIGLDGFGIHSENYALKIGKHPADQAKISEKRFYKQLEMIGNGYAWNEKLETYDPEYYKWTQWIFVQMFKHGLAYRKKAMVNWCPSCLTVLADEQVLAGECERCGNKVIKKELEQWFFKITDYAERLLANLDKIDSVRVSPPPKAPPGGASAGVDSNGIDWSEKIKVAQRNWIGKSEGALIGFRVEGLGNKGTEEKIDVFTTRPDTIYGATYMVVAPEHEIISKIKNKISNIVEVENYIKRAKSRSEQERITEGKEKTGVELRGIKAINPANQKEIPVWVADYVLGHVGTGAIMAVPAHDERDAEFARKFDLPFSDAPLADPKEIIKKVGAKNIIQYRLRDWLISRQRYWGPPIPVVFCENCKKQLENSKFEIRNSKFNRGELENPGWLAVPEEDLPVKLPKVKDFRPTGTEKSPLASIEKFVKVKCPKCGSQARRETDVSDTFLDSAWYYIGYLMAASNWKLEIGNWKLQEAIRKWLPVDMYIGGAEHAVLHLLYVRFLAMVFHDWGLIDFEEPATKFRAHGLLIKDGAKMSKSRGNVVIPDEYIKKYGADVLRMYLMFLGPFEQGGDFRDESIAGIVRFISRVWNLKEKGVKEDNPELGRPLHKSIKKIGEDLEKLHYNTAISELMILAHEFENGFSREQLGVFVKLLAPFAPHLAEEIWRKVLGRKKSIHIENWPEYDPGLVADDHIDFVVQINGRARAMIRLAAKSNEDQVRAAALVNEKVKKYIADRKIKKVVFVPDRLINFVLE